MVLPLLLPLLKRCLRRRWHLLPPSKMWPKTYLTVQGSCWTIPTLFSVSFIHLKLICWWYFWLNYFFFLGADLVEQQAMLDELNRKIEEQKKQLASMETEVSSSPLIGGGESVVIPGLEPVIPGLEPSSNSWSDSIQAYDNPSPPRPPSTGLNQISIPTNLQARFIASLIRKYSEINQKIDQQLNKYWFFKILLDIHTKL